MTTPEPTRRQIRRWRHYLADEIAERTIYGDIAQTRTGEEREILEALSMAEGRHADHWRNLLGEHVGTPRISLGTRVLGFLARRFGSVFVLAMAQRAEARSPYSGEADATPTMAADERIHEEVVRGLAAKGRTRLSGTFRAAVFGANDGLISNLSLVVGVAAGGVSTQTILLSGVAGLLGGALSMGAGEYVSVSSQRELLEASKPQRPDGVLADLDMNANELALVYRSRGMDAEAADSRAQEVLRGVHRGQDIRPTAAEQTRDDVIGTGLRAAVSSFLFFSLGAIIPVLPFLLGVPRPWAMWTAIGMVGVGLLLTGAMVGLLSGSSPLRRGLRQLGIGFGAATVTYLLGLLFGA
ncbi:MAG: VIT1/CCC1 transporter family protein [Microbacteriaceae bacterium]|jgi:VIT1/CCC1 family predicted Fe2+/Mn2+ transporter|nr:VIT1/CCC1 transporter family protein [Microbacteriaceae bacterium]MCI1207022.1 VIT1/CCC1 transporter family protein [Microbacteriaceae bacterium]